MLGITITVRFFTVAAVIPSDGEEAGVERHSLDSMSSRFTNDSSEHPLCGESKNSYSFTRFEKLSCFRWGHQPGRTRRKGSVNSSSDGTPKYS